VDDREVVDGGRLSDILNGGGKKNRGFDGPATGDGSLMVSSP